MYFLLLRSVPSFLHSFILLQTCPTLPLSHSLETRPFLPPPSQVPYLEPLQIDLLLPLLPRLLHSIDILLFNPPYVPTPSSEVGSRGIEASWAGGEDGREVLDRLLPSIPSLLSPQGGCMYLVTVNENRPEEICARMREAGLGAKVGQGRGGWEWVGKGMGEALCALVG